jgi:hypothetical protein
MSNVSLSNILTATAAGTIAPFSASNLYNISNTSSIPTKMQPLNIGFFRGLSWVVSIFMPSSISGLEAWYDMTSANNMTMNTNNQILQLNDMSGTNHGMRIGTGWCTLSANQINSKSGVQFVNGGNQGFKLSTPATCTTVIAVGFAANSSKNNMFCGAMTNMAGFGGMYCKFFDVGNAEFFRPNTANTVTQGPKVAVAINTPIVYVGYVSGTTQNLKLNGSTVKTVINTGTLRTITDTYVGAISGDLAISYSSLGGTMCEIMFYNRTLTSIDIAKLEGHLAWKYGIQALLPVSHTFKSAAPTAV